jgi:flagellar motor protein MotB
MRSEEDSYLVSVSDLMVGLLFIFIIMLMAFALDYRTATEDASTAEARHLQEQADLAVTRDHVVQERDRLAQERDRLADERDRLIAERNALEHERDRLAEASEQLLQRDALRAQMLRNIRAELTGRAIDVAIEPENGILRLPEELLFDSGEATFRPEGRRALGVLAEVLDRLLPCYSSGSVEGRRCPGGTIPLLEAVLIEGHTDDVPLRASSFRDNWDLAAVRALNTFRALTEAAPTLDGLRNARGEALLGVSSYEARRPVMKGDSPDARRLNRRIDLRFLVSAPAEAELRGFRRRSGE